MTPLRGKNIEGPPSQLYKVVKIQKRQDLDIGTNVTTIEVAVGIPLPMNQQDDPKTSDSLIPSTTHEIQSPAIAVRRDSKSVTRISFLKPSATTTATASNKEPLPQIRAYKIYLPSVAAQASFISQLTTQLTVNSKKNR